MDLMNELVIRKNNSKRNNWINISKIIYYYYKLSKLEIHEKELNIYWIVYKSVAK